ncbi:hypothetical protein C1752_05003 [Acaryochloris thomasi RCC1774]|uniref:PQ loop repeat protein n=1 Tax=Acaryochloris thomasi RCC1774 TaxID=1764569 RepID=A0A2W1JNI1_9CYAN|nr:hypothetical protein [Acaryochloris thomasi]PZD71704.1 hypothetical protein C1752_05003 [Acaryochloris thomasi RCC1774]
MNATVVSLSGWLPAVIIPMATLIQLTDIFKRRSAAGVSWLTWFLFGIANIGLYVYTEKYGSIQSIVGLLGPASLDFAIAFLAFFSYGGNSSGTEPATDA